MGLRASGDLPEDKCPESRSSIFRQAIRLVKPLLPPSARQFRRNQATLQLSEVAKNTRETGYAGKPRAPPCIYPMQPGHSSPIVLVGKILAGFAQVVVDILDVPLTCVAVRRACRQLRRGKESDRQPAP